MTNIQRLSPEPPSSKIEDAEVTANKLSSVLFAAVIESEVEDDGDIYATDGLNFPVWISIDTERKVLTFLTFLDPREGSGKVVETIVNELNSSMIWVQFYWHSDKIWGQCWMTFDGGLDPRQFIKVLRRFSGAFSAGAERFTVPS